MAAAATVRAASEREERERREDDDEWTEERRRHEEFIANRGRPAVRMTARRGGPVPPAPAPSGQYSILFFIILMIHKNANYVLICT